jgi:hypothetical protein
MPAPSTIIYLKDEDGDEFPIRLPNIYRSNLPADIEAALHIIRQPDMAEKMHPRGEVEFVRVEYID